MSPTTQQSAGPQPVGPQSVGPQFVWYELMTSDADAAADFYGHVLGWSSRDSGLASHRYDYFMFQDSMVGGLMPLPPQLAEVGVRPHWTGFVGVRDVDETVKALTETGGSVHHAPADIPNIGRFAIVADPHGAVFGLFSPKDAPPPQSCAASQVLWRELMAGDGAQAFDFYAGLFGWTLADSLDMGPMGAYRIFATGSERAGGMMTKPAELPMPPHWRFYFRVDEIDASLERIKAAGGEILMGPHQVPGGDWIIQALDPQGALFAVVGPRE